MLPVYAQSNTDDQIHTVQAGETLSEIAKDYGVALDDLMALNGISDADAIYVGQELQLPAVAQWQPTATPLPSHTVQAGETLSEIAKAYGVSLTQLMRYNNIQDADAVYVGQHLRIPPAADEVDETTPTPSPTVEPTVSTQPTPTPPDEDEPPTAEAPDEETETEAVEAEQVEATAEAAPIADEATPNAVDRTRLTTSLNSVYTVRSGDTLARIALRTGVDFDALRQLNGIAAAEIGNLAAGQTLILPATGADLQVRTQEREYVVEPGDSLGSIANQFDLTLADLLTANRLADPDSIIVGQRLIIPGKVLDNEAPQATQVGPQRSGFYYYTVQRGDTLSELARAFNSTKLALLEYNGLPDEETVYAGLEIRIPYGPPALPNQRPPVPASSTSFLVSLSRQQCWLFQGDRVAYAWTCSTGYGEWITRTGSFAVQSKIENAQSSAYRLDMPYWLGIYNVGPYENGIHGLPVEWDTGEKIWERLIGEPATFGCAMLDDRDAVVLFNRAYIGMPVHIIH
ncbi:MAG: LysM peptidoglycan-binding domain-containing protein [Caldilineaceae bacterium]